MNIGDKFGRLTVLQLLPPDKNVHTRAKVKCICGVIKIVQRTNLLSGNTRACGCLQRESASAMGKLSRTHGHTSGGSKTTLYITWIGMIQRCTNPKATGFSTYGGRGIKVCKRWLTSFQNFLQDIGKRPANHTLDRINNNGHYAPNNVRWATAKQQCQNRRVYLNG